MRRVRALAGSGGTKENENVAGPVGGKLVRDLLSGFVGGLPEPSIGRDLALEREKAEEKT